MRNISKLLLAISLVIIATACSGKSNCSCTLVENLLNEKKEINKDLNVKISQLHEKEKTIQTLKDVNKQLEEKIAELRQTNSTVHNDLQKNDLPKKTEVPNIQERSIIIDKNKYLAIGTLACQQESLDKVMGYLKNHPNAKTFKIGKSTISRTDLQDKTDAIQHLLNVLKTQGNRPDQKQDFERWYINNKKHFSTGSNNDVNSQQQKAIEMIIKKYDDFKNSSKSFTNLLQCGEQLGFLKVSRTKKVTTIRFK